MKKENNELYNNKVQKILKKLISEEYIASDFYNGCIKSTCKCQSIKFSQMFVDISIDEVNDHAKKLIDWAIENDYDVPFKYKDYEKFASEEVVKQFNGLKTKQDAKYYINEALKSEKFAIASYEEAMSEDEIPYDLNCILMQNYYDELEHYEMLQTLSYAYDNEVLLVNY